MVSELSKNPDGYKGQECLPRESISDSQCFLKASNGQFSLPLLLFQKAHIDENLEHVDTLLDFPIREKPGPVAK